MKKDSAPEGREIAPTKAAGERISARDWQKVLACGDVLDSFPCESCGARVSNQCRIAVPESVWRPAGAYINGYGWDAARKLAEPRP